MAVHSVFDKSVAHVARAKLTNGLGLWDVHISSLCCALNDLHQLLHLIDTCDSDKQLAQLLLVYTAIITQPLGQCVGHM